MKAPNLKKQLLDGLKKDVKATTKDAPSGRDFRVLVDGRAVAHVFKGANGSLRIYVRAAKLPAPLAKSFTLTKSSGYAATFKNASELEPAIEAILVAASEEQA